jgi:hypothetical protein
MLHPAVRYFLLFTLFTAALPLCAQYTAKVQMTEHVEGICDSTEVYHLWNTFDGQKQATCTVSDAAIQARLNSGVTYLKDNPKFKLPKGASVSTWVNCEGALVKVKMDSKNAAFNEQVEAVFRDLGEWTAGRTAGKNVDSVRLWGITIYKGYIFLQ